MIIAVDFDGTLVDHQYPNIGQLVPGAFEWLRLFQDTGCTLILWTMRSDGAAAGDVLSDALALCEEQGIQFAFVNEHPQDWTRSPKVYAHVYIDDSAFGCPLTPNPMPEGRPWVNWEIVGPAIWEMVRRGPLGTPPTGGL